MKIQGQFAQALISYLFLGLFFSLTGKVLTLDHRITTQALFASSDMLLATPPQAVNIYPVSPEILAIEVPAPAVNKGTQRPYQAQPGDRVTHEDYYSRVDRNGVGIGMLVGPDDNILYTYDQIEDTAFSIRKAEANTSYLITSDNDADYGSPTSPVSIFRKTKPTNFAYEEADGFQWPAASTLYLTLPTPLEPGNTYQLSFPALGLEDTTFSYQPESDRSEAVHISQLGFRPDDPLKVGYLSTWMGDGGGLDYPDNLGFQVVNQQTNQAVYEGTASFVHGPNRAEDPRGRDYTLSEVHKLDFSDFNQPGEYRLCVEGIGCSFDFEIADNVWQDAFFTSARGFYHQRSGIALKEPYTSFTRPRAFHPDDGMKIYQSEATLQEVDMGLGDLDTFTELNGKATDTLVSDAWGGYFDAGDWDRRIQHVAVPRGLLELHNLFPDYFKTVSLNIPESDNALPDILDEALWTLDFFRRMQTSNGGIRGGIQSEREGGVYGEASWQESLKVLAYAPDVWSSYMYAGVAARAAATLEGYDPSLASTYRESALKAMAYAEENYQEGAYDEGEQLHNVKDQRNLAALELYRLTRENQWHELFLSTTVFTDPAAETSIYGLHEQREAAFLYARLNEALPPGAESLPVDAQIQSNARGSVLRYADDLVELTKTTAFGWSKEHPNAPVGWGNGLGSAKGMNVLQAHALTQDDKYLLAGISSTQFPGGANPDNMVFTTGLGDRSPQNPLIGDARVTAQSPPPGITLYGPADLTNYTDYWTIQEIASSTFPSPEAWPTAENYFDIYMYPIGAEFTVDYMMTPTYTWGYLAAREGQD